MEGRWSGSVFVTFRGRKGLVQVNCTRLLDEEGKECKTPRQKQER